MDEKFNGEESVYLDPSSVGLSVTDITNAKDCKVISEVERLKLIDLSNNLTKLRDHSSNLVNISLNILDGGVKY